METSIFFYKKELKNLIGELLSTNEINERINLINEIKLLREVLNNVEDYYMMTKNYEYFKCCPLNNLIY